MDEIAAAIQANCKYAINDSTTQAADYKEAITVLLFSPERATKGQEEYQFNLKIMERQLEAVDAWLASRVGGSGFGGETYCATRRIR